MLLRHSLNSRSPPFTCLRCDRASCAPGQQHQLTSHRPAWPRPEASGSESRTLVRADSPHGPSTLADIPSGAQWAPAPALAAADTTAQKQALVVLRALGQFKPQRDPDAPPRLVRLPAYSPAQISAALQHGQLFLPSFSLTQLANMASALAALGQRDTAFLAALALEATQQLQALSALHQQKQLSRQQAAARVAAGTPRQEQAGEAAGRLPVPIAPRRQQQQQQQRLRQQQQQRRRGIRLSRSRQLPGTDWLLRLQQPGQALKRRRRYTTSLLWMALCDLAVAFSQLAPAAAAAVAAPGPAAAGQAAAGPQAQLMEQLADAGAWVLLSAAPPPFKTRASVRTLPLILWAFARQQLYPPALVAAVAQLVKYRRPVLYRLGPWGLLQLLWSVAAMGHQDQTLVLLVMQRAATQVGMFDCQQLSQAYAMLAATKQEAGGQQQQQQLFELHLMASTSSTPPLQQQQRQQQQKEEHQQLRQPCCVPAQPQPLPFHLPEGAALLAVLRKCTRQRLNSFKPQQLAALMSGLAGLGLQDLLLLDETARWIYNKSGSLSPQDALACIAAASQLRYHNPWLMAQLARVLVSRRRLLLPQLAPQQLLQLLQSLAGLGCCNQQLLVHLGDVAVDPEGVAVRALESLRQEGLPTRGVAALEQQLVQRGRLPAPAAAGAGAGGSGGLAAEPRVSSAVRPPLLLLPLLPLEQWPGQQVVELVEGFTLLRFRHGPVLKAAATAAAAAAAGMGAATPLPTEGGAAETESRGSAPPPAAATPAAGASDLPARSSSNSSSSGWSVRQVVALVCALSHFRAVPLHLLERTVGLALAKPWELESSGWISLGIAAATAAGAGGGGGGDAKGVAGKKHQQLLRVVVQQLQQVLPQQLLALDQLTAAGPGLLLLMQAVWAVGGSANEPSSSSSSSEVQQSEAAPGAAASKAHKQQQQQGGAAAGFTARSSSSSGLDWQLGLDAELVSNYLSGASQQLVAAHQELLREVVLLLQFMLPPPAAAAAGRSAAVGPGRAAAYEVHACYRPQGCPLLLPVALLPFQAGFGTAGAATGSFGSSAGPWASAAATGGVESSPGIAVLLLPAAGTVSSEQHQLLGWPWLLQRCCEESCGWRVAVLSLEQWEEAGQLPVAGRRYKRQQLLTAALREAGLRL